MSAIIVNEGVLSTDNIRIENEKPDRYRYFDIKNMTKYNKGDMMHGKIYSEEKGDMEELPLYVAGFANNDQIADYGYFHSDFLWIIVSNHTCEKMMKLTGRTFGKSLYIKKNETDDAILERLRQLEKTYENSDTSYHLKEVDSQEMTETIAGALVEMINVLLTGFVILASVICMMNLSNSISGRMADRRREFAVFQSVGMTRRQIQKMLLWECVGISAQSVLFATVITALVSWMIYGAMTSLFGRLSLLFPLGIYIGTICFTVFIVIAITLYDFHKEKSEDMLANIRNESI